MFWGIVIAVCVWTFLGPFIIPSIAGVDSNVTDKKFYWLVLFCGPMVWLITGISFLILKAIEFREDIRR